MAIGIYKTFTRQKLTYQDMNGLQTFYSNYINNYLLLVSDCVAVNTPNKVVKRDSLGNFTANEITANLVGNVTGNVTGDVTGDVTGNITGDLKIGSSIGGHVLTDIFEDDGLTAKKASDILNSSLPIAFPYPTTDQLSSNIRLPKDKTLTAIYGLRNTNTVAAISFGVYLADGTLIGEVVIPAASSSASLTVSHAFTAGDVIYVKCTSGDGLSIATVELMFE